VLKLNIKSEEGRKGRLGWKITQHGRMKRRKWSVEKVENLKKNPAVGVCAGGSSAVKTVTCSVENGRITGRARLVARARVDG
jgi:hypothetical protein